jgi:1,4-dihydroxy-2-naphthoate octaprenyltransferase
MLVAILLIQVGAHLINDYYDYMHGVDMTNPYGTGGLIQQGIVKSNAAFRLGLTLLVCGAGVGVIIALAGGPLVFLLGAIGLLGAFFYSATARSLSSLALGEVVAFFLFGPLTTLGAYLVMSRTGQIDRSAIAYGTLLGLFAAAVIHVNNTRDIESDEHAGKRTLPGILGVRLSRVIFTVLLLLAYLLILSIGLPHAAPHFVLLTLWTLPLLVVVLTGIVRSSGPASFNLVVYQTLRLETLFAILLIIGLVITAFLPALPPLPTHLIPFLK